MILIIGLQILLVLPLFHLHYVHVMTVDDIPMPLAGVGSIVTPNLSL